MPACCTRPKSHFIHDFLQVWDDGTMAAPLASLKEDVAEPSPLSERTDRSAHAAAMAVAVATVEGADPGILLPGGQALQSAASDSAGRASGERASGGAVPHAGAGGGSDGGEHGGETEGEGYSDDSPRVSL
jgi:hypothetical protein